MKLLWLTENYYPNRGGMAQSCDRIVYNLRQTGIIIDVIHFSNRRKPFANEKQLNGSYTACSLNEDVSHSLNLLNNYLLSLKEKQYDYLVAFGGYLPVFSAPVLAKWFNWKLITLFRGNDFDSAVFTPKRRDYLFYAIENSEIIFTVDSTKKLKIEKLFPQKRVEFIANGINTNDWYAGKSDLKNAKKLRERKIPENKKIIGLFGHLKHKKGLDFFLEAIRISGQTEKIHLLIVGELPEKSKELLNLSEISFSAYNFMDKYELLSYYPACDAVAIPSFYDGMPNVLLEAGALGVTFIASEVDGIKDLMTKPDFGFLFTPGNLHECSHSIISFVNSDKEKLKEKGKKLKKHIIKYFDDKIETEKYLKAINA